MRSSSAGSNVECIRKTHLIRNMMIFKEYIDGRKILKLVTEDFIHISHPDKVLNPTCLES
jgi:hypothetical protein